MVYVEDKVIFAYTFFYNKFVNYLFFSSYYRPSHPLPRNVKSAVKEILFLLKAALRVLSSACTTPNTATLTPYLA